LKFDRKVLSLNITAGFRDAPIPSLDLDLVGLGFSEIQIESLVYADSCKLYNSTITNFNQFWLFLTDSDQFQDLELVGLGWN
jgi:hypothetical protein